MFPLKTLVIAVILAMLFAPRSNACSLTYQQTVEAPAAITTTQPDLAQTDTSQPDPASTQETAIELVTVAASAQQGSTAAPN